MPEISPRTGADPTKAILSESKLNKKYLCDYVINVATGCRHGCKFCYVPSTPVIRTRPDMLKEEVNVDNPQHEWGEYVLYRDDIVEEIDGLLDRKQKWKSTDGGCGIVGISFATDCYMDGRSGRITKEVVSSLSNHGRYSRVLTRNPILALQDSDIFVEAGEFVTIGSSIPTLSSEEIKAIEPKAPAPAHRLRGLEKFHEMGVQTFVSMSPTYPTQSKEDIRNLMSKVSKCSPEVVFHEPINPRSGNFQMTIQAAQDAGELELARELERLLDRDYWFDYSMRHFRWVQEIGEEMGLSVHLWPDDKHLKMATGEEEAWLRQWRDRQPMERFAGRDCPTTTPPEIPNQ